MLADGQIHWQTQTDFIICPMLYVIAMGQISSDQLVLILLPTAHNSMKVRECRFSQLDLKPVTLPPQYSVVKCHLNTFCVNMCSLHSDAGHSAVHDGHSVLLVLHMWYGSTIIGHSVLYYTCNMGLLAVHANHVQSYKLCVLYSTVCGIIHQWRKLKTELSRPSVQQCWTQHYCSFSETTLQKQPEVSLKQINE